MSTPSNAPDSSSSSAGAQSSTPVVPAGKHPAPPCTLVIFGAGGDLTKRLLMPALYNLTVDGLLDPQMKIIGVNHGQVETSAWRDDLYKALQQFAADKASTFHTSKLDDKAWSSLAQRKAGLLKEGDDGKGFRRIVIEKPFGTDLASARDLNEHILSNAKEEQVYRIDHFLGKDTVQSIMAVRFANALFEPIWRREYIDCVQITASETIGVEGRGSFYEQTGAFRDMLPNHLFQLLGMVAMEPPNSFDAEAVRDKKADIFDAIQPVKPDDVVFGQYEKGPAGPGYRQEPDVAPDSQTETYAAARVLVENWRWSGVPFYLRTGKRLAARRTEISVQLKTVPFRLFRDTPVNALTPNVLTLRIDPTHGTSFDFNVKAPGPIMQMGAVQSSFNYGDFFDEQPNVGYETLLYDCMLGDETLFQRADSIETSWAAVDDVLHPKGSPLPVHGYPAGSQGPAEADALLARNGHAWRPLSKDKDADAKK